MAVTIKSLTEEYIPAVKEFNARLTAASVSFDLRFPEYSISDWLPKIEERRLYQENFILLEEGVVRGGYRVKRQDFSFRGKILPVDCFHWPMSEGVINKAYSWVFTLMLRHVQENQPLLYSLGMAGSEETLIPRILKAAGWKVSTVPFFFKVNHPRQFLHGIQAIRKTALRRWLLDIIAWTGIGALPIRTIQRVRTTGICASEGAERVRGFAAWANDLWNQCKRRYAMIAVRDAESLNILYPADNERFLSYKISRGNKILGWAVLLDRRMRSNKYFGNMRVGTILDCLAKPEDAEAVARIATRMLEERGVDLIISNQLQTHWCSALRKAGFFCGPSNFSFGVSRDLGNLLVPFDSLASRVHMTRGDGEGPLHL
jgi:hypothetical protein